LKRKKLLKIIVSTGCVFMRHGANHDWYKNPQTGKSQPIPRHTEIEEGLASGRNDLGGKQTRRPEHKGMTAAPKLEPRTEVVVRDIVGSRPCPNGGKADVPMGRNG